MNRATKSKLAHMRMTILDLQRRNPRQRGRPRIVPLEVLKALYRNSLNEGTRTYMQQLSRKETEPWKRKP
jgi:hypothetical protein